MAMASFEKEARLPTKGRFASAGCDSADHVWVALTFEREKSN